MSSSTIGLWSRPKRRDLAPLPVVLPRLRTSSRLLFPEPSFKSCSVAEIGMNYDGFTGASCRKH